MADQIFIVHNIRGRFGIHTAPPHRVIGIVCCSYTPGDNDLDFLCGVDVLECDQSAGLFDGDGDLDLSLAGCRRLCFGLVGGEALLRGIVDQAIACVL